MDARARREFRWLVSQRRRVMEAVRRRRLWRRLWRRLGPVAALVAVAAIVGLAVAIALTLKPGD